jgi:hypothetical protein
MQVPLSPILLFSYLRFAEAASFDKKELCRSDTAVKKTEKILQNNSAET